MDCLYWFANYYYCNNSSLTYCYQHLHAPLASDFINVFKSWNDGISNNTIDNRDKLNITLKDQAIIIIPMKSDVLDKSMINKRKSMKSSIHMFPNKFKLDMVCKKSIDECIPMIPGINI